MFAGNGNAGSWLLGEVVPFEGGMSTIPRTSDCSYCGPVSGQATGIDTGVLIVVLTVASSQLGRPSGAQSGLPSKRPAVVSTEMGKPGGKGPSCTTSWPLVKIPST